jgi:hypothetical protein
VWSGELLQLGDFQSTNALANFVFYSFCRFDGAVDWQVFALRAQEAVGCALEGIVDLVDVLRGIAAYRGRGEVAQLFGVGGEGCFLDFRFKAVNELRYSGSWSLGRLRGAGFGT